jgi:hypothetical protein
MCWTEEGKRKLGGQEGKWWGIYSRGRESEHVQCMPNLNLLAVSPTLCVYLG